MGEVHKDGREQEAQDLLVKLRALQPKFSLDFVRQAGFHWEPRITHHRIEALRDLGIPERS